MEPSDVEELQSILKNKTIRDVIIEQKLDKLIPDGFGYPIGPRVNKELGWTKDNAQMRFKVYQPGSKHYDHQYCDSEWKVVEKHVRIYACERVYNTVPYHPTAPFCWGDIFTKDPSKPHSVSILNNKKTKDFVYSLYPLFTELLTLSEEARADKVEKLKWKCQTSIDHEVVRNDLTERVVLLLNMFWCLEEVNDCIKGYPLTICKESDGPLDRIIIYLTYIVLNRDKEMFPCRKSCDSPPNKRQINLDKKVEEERKLYMKKVKALQYPYVDGSTIDDIFAEHGLLHIDDSELYDFLC